jgi:Phytanoyl-CoA dioxygenase (PhyH)
MTAGSENVAIFEEIQALREAGRGERDPEVARRILRLGHLAGVALVDRAGEGPSDHPAPAFDGLAEGARLPEVAPVELTPELLRAAMVRSGCLLVRAAVDEDDVTRLVEGIGRAYAAREAQARAGSTGDGYFEEFQPDPRFDVRFDRGVIRDGAALLAADSPLVLLDVIDALERAGLKRLATDYLASDRPVISVNKCLLRRTRPGPSATSHGAGGFKLSAWHQDGAFLGEVRALNVWLSLSHCGDDAPGLDIVPRRLDKIVPTGTKGAVFDWSASVAVAEEAAGDAGIVRPIFAPGDVLLFDELLLHATAAEPGMRGTRYAVENWFFDPSNFPPRYTPLAF